MPATGRFIGTPASIMASEAPHTEAIDEEPFELGDLRDDADRVGELVRLGQQADATARHASLPWPISRRPGPPMRPVSPTE